MAKKRNPGVYGVEADPVAPPVGEMVSRLLGLSGLSKKKKAAKKRPKKRRSKKRVKKKTVKRRKRKR